MKNIRYATTKALIAAMDDDILTHHERNMWEYIEHHYLTAKGENL